VGAFTLLILGLAMVFLLAVALGIAILWETVTIYRERRAFRFTIRKFEVARRAVKAEPDDS
jgi:hypothetical protein